MLTTRQLRLVGKPLVFAACLAPAAWLVAGAFGLHGGLGANPIEVFQDELGTWGLRLLLLTLAVSPLSRILGRPWPIQFRRMLGLFAFFYCSLHFANYLVLDQAMDWPAVVADIVERPFVTVGFAALMLMVPLAVTSTGGWRRRLGRRWNLLHRLVYATVVLGCWHFYWQARENLTEPLLYAGVTAVLLLARLAPPRRKTRQPGKRTGAAESGSLRRRPGSNAAAMEAPGRVSEKPP